MARIALFLVAVAALAACSQNEAERKLVADRCVADGESEPVCKCLADESAKKLDGELFKIVVLGAKGEDKETDAQIKELPKDKQLLFTAVTREVARGCGANDYLVAN
jgi:hypothetical protein